MPKSKMDEHILHFGKNPKETTSLNENQKILNSKDFRLKEAMIHADSVVGPQLIWSFDDAPVNSETGEVLERTNTHTYTNTNYPPGGGTTYTQTTSKTTLTPSNFWVPNHVYYSSHDWPMQGVITAGIRVVRFITLFTFDDYCGVQQDGRFKYLYGNIDPTIDRIKQYAIDIPNNGKAWLQQSKMGIGFGGDVMIAGHYGPANWVGPTSPIGSRHHMRFMRYVCPLTTNQNFLNTDVLNILILFNNDFIPTSTTTGYYSPGHLTEVPVMGMSDANFPQAVYDVPHYVPWVGSGPNTESNGNELGAGTFMGAGNNIPAFTRYGMQTGLEHPYGPFCADSCITGPGMSYDSWLAASGDVFDSGSGGGYFGTGNFNGQYGPGSKWWNEDIERLAAAYSKFYRHKTILFHSAPPSQGIVSGFDTPRSFNGISPGLFPNCSPRTDTVLSPNYATFDIYVKWSVQAVKPLLQNMCTELASYGFSYGGTVSEETTFDDFLPFIQDYLSN